MTATKFERPEQELAVEMPSPTLWRILVQPLAAQEHTDSGLALTKKTQEDQGFITVVGKITAMGSLAYKSDKFSDENSPGVGAWVLYPIQAGQKVEMADGRVYIIMNDDAVIARVSDPELYRKKLI